MYPMGRAESGWRSGQRITLDRWDTGRFKAMVRMDGIVFSDVVSEKNVTAGRNGVDGIHQTDDREQGETTRPPSLAGDHAE